MVGPGVLRDEHDPSPLLLAGRPKGFEVVGQERADALPDERRVVRLLPEGRPRDERPRRKRRARFVEVREALVDAARDGGVHHEHDHRAVGGDRVVGRQPLDAQTRVVAEVEHADADFAGERRDDRLDEVGRIAFVLEDHLGHVVGEKTVYERLEWPSPASVGRAPGRKVEGSITFTDVELRVEGIEGSEGDVSTR